jgi:hypothetical protein
VATRFDVGIVTRDVDAGIGGRGVCAVADDAPATSRASATPRV